MGTTFDRQAMSQPEIAKKLAAFLADHVPLTEECHVIYFLVEIRKILDHKNNSDACRLLRFYADWSVHTRKDRISKEMKAIIGALYDAAAAHIASPKSEIAHQPVMEFAYMRELGKELAQFLDAHGLDSRLAHDKKSWIAFAGLLVKVLENQPIISPVENVEKFIFEPANERCVIGTLFFVKPVNEMRYYQFGSAY